MSMVRPDSTECQASESRRYAEPMVKGEFTIYPFIEGPEPPRHVLAAMEAIREVGLEAELGPLGQTVVGPDDVVLDALRRAEAAALAAGATSIVIRLEVVE
jgi:uncharacterized protein YqgV (UPF0045/DUF77 family)